MRYCLALVLSWPEAGSDRSRARQRAAGCPARDGLGLQLRGQGMTCTIALREPAGFRVLLLRLVLAQNPVAYYGGRCASASRFVPDSVSCSFCSGGCRSHLAPASRSVSSETCGHEPAVPWSHSSVDPCCFCVRAVRLGVFDRQFIPYSFEQTLGCSNAVTFWQDVALVFNTNITAITGIKCRAHK